MDVQSDIKQENLVLMETCLNSKKLCYLAHKFNEIIDGFVVPYCYLFLLSVFILWFSYYVSDIFCKC